MDQSFEWKTEISTLARTVVQTIYQRRIHLILAVTLTILISNWSVHKSRLWEKMLQNMIVRVGSFIKSNGLKIAADAVVSDHCTALLLAVSWKRHTKKSQREGLANESLGYV